MLTGLHFLLTYTCNFECDHCFVYSRPGAKGTFTIAQIRDVYNTPQKLDQGLRWKRPPVRLMAERRSFDATKTIQRGVQGAGGARRAPPETDVRCGIAQDATTNPGIRHVKIEFMFLNSDRPHAKSG